VIHLSSRDELFCQGGTKGDLYKWIRDSDSDSDHILF
jgi:hypothetical protein